MAAIRPEQHHTIIAPPREPEYFRTPAGDTKIPAPMMAPNTKMMKHSAIQYVVVHQKFYWKYLLIRSHLILSLLLQIYHHKNSIDASSLNKLGQSISIYLSSSY